MKSLCFALLAFLVALARAEVPSYMQVCGRRNPELAKCVLESVENLKERLKNGIPELKVPAMEPLYIDLIHLINIPNFRASARDVKLYGLSSFETKSFKIDLDKKIINIEIFMKTVRLTADYDVDAKILVPIAGRGPIDMISTDVFSKSVLKFKLVNHKGKEYMFFNSMTTKLSVKDYTAKFAPSDGPESPLATGINAALQNSRQELLEGTIPNLEKTISEKVLHIANQICSLFPYDELLPDRE